MDRLVSFQLVVAAGSCKPPVATFGWVSRKERSTAQHRDRPGSQHVALPLKAKRKPVHADKSMCPGDPGSPEDGAQSGLSTTGSC